MPCHLSVLKCRATLWYYFVFVSTIWLLIDAYWRPFASLLAPFGIAVYYFRDPLDFAAIVTNFWARIVAGNGAEMEPSGSKLEFNSAFGALRATVLRVTLNALGSDT